MMPVAKPRLMKSPSGNVIYYSCPVYHTPARAGNKVVSTTGNSINYVTTMELPSTEEERYWAKRGVAMYLSTPE